RRRTRVARRQRGTATIRTRAPVPAGSGREARVSRRSRVPAPRATMKPANTPRRTEPSSTQLEARLEVQIEERALARPDTARYVHAEQPVQERHPRPGAADRTSRMAPRVAIPRPADVVEDRRPCDRELFAELAPPEPVRVPGLTRLGQARPLATYRVRTADVPRPLWRKRAARVARTARQSRAEAAAKPARKRRVERATRVVERPRRGLTAKIRQQAPTVR